MDLKKEVLGKYINWGANDTQMVFIDMRLDEFMQRTNVEKSRIQRTGRIAEGGRAAREREIQ